MGMTFLSWMQPRDHRAAARTVSMLSAAAVAVTIVFAPVAPGNAQLSALHIGIAVATVTMVAVLGWLAHLLDETNRVAWAVVPLLAVVAIVVVDFSTADASVSAQIFFLFPTLYGASQLPRAGAVVMTAASVVGEIVVVGATLPLREAMTDTGYVAAALVTTAVLLIRAGERQAALVARLQSQAAIDPLTGLSTRWVLDEAAETALSGAASVEGTALILLDVDHFKSINDRYGHPGGDEVLVQLAHLLVGGSRRGDVVSRMGGDEIALLLPGCSAESLHPRAEQIAQDVRKHAFELSDGEQVVVSVSVGLAHCPTHALALRDLYVAADAALYEAKRSGRDRVSYPTIVLQPEKAQLSTPTEGPAALRQLLP